MKLISLILVLLALCMPACAMEMDGDCIYRLYSGDTYLTCRAGRMYVDDEYIANDNKHYRVYEVDDSAKSAYAEAVEETFAAFSAYAKDKDSGVICMYSTHSDESYIEGDGDFSLKKNAGIYDVGEEFKKALEEKSIAVEYSDKTFLPHDAGAYSRSRSTATELLSENPDALFDIHRDGVPADEYETTVDGNETSMVRLFVGKSNQNSDANMAFAKEIKATADEKYPGLIKDIYMGKGNYNQELYPRALLLEFGTHEIDKELVLESTSYMADVVSETLYGENAKDKSDENKGVGKGVVWIIVAVVIAAIVFALFATGRLSNMWGYIKRGAGEMIGRKRR